MTWNISLEHKNIAIDLFGFKSYQKFYARYGVPNREALKRLSELFFEPHRGVLDFIKRFDTEILQPDNPADTSTLLKDVIADCVNIVADAQLGKIKKTHIATPPHISISNPVQLPRYEDPVAQNIATVFINLCAWYIAPLLEAKHFEHFTLSEKWTRTFIQQKNELSTEEARVYSNEVLRFIRQRFGKLWHQPIADVALVILGTSGIYQLIILVDMIKTALELEDKK